MRKYFGEILHELAKRKGIQIEEGHLMKDHIHMCISIPPKYAVLKVVGYLKGKSAISIARKFKGWQKNFDGEDFWTCLLYTNQDLWLDGFKGIFTLISSGFISYEPYFIAIFQLPIEQSIHI